MPRRPSKNLRRLLDHLDLEKAHLVGQSMGGWVVAGFALRHAERTRSLVLANTYGGVSTEAMWEWVRRAGWWRFPTPATRLTSSDPTPGTARCSNISAVDCVSPGVPQRAFRGVPIPG